MSDLATSNRVNRSVPWVLAVLGGGVPSLVATVMGADVVTVGSVQIATLTIVVVVVLAGGRWAAWRPLAVGMWLLATFLHVGLNLARRPGAGLEVLTSGAAERQVLAWQLISSAASVAIFLALRLTGITSGELFLGAGSTAAPAGGVRLLGLAPGRSWRRQGRDLSLMLTGGTLVFLVLGGAFEGLTLRGLAGVLPWVLGLAVVNALNEEFQFRSMILAGVGRGADTSTAIAVSAFVFGSWHFAGVPGGVIGASMAGFAGWIWAMAMAETRGMLMPWFLHFLQDVVIFAALFA